MESVVSRLLERPMTPITKAVTVTRRMMSSGSFPGCTIGAKLPNRRTRGSGYTSNAIPYRMWHKPLIRLSLCNLGPANKPTYNRTQRVGTSSSGESAMRRPSKPHAAFSIRVR